jgi:hypothetical protein
METEEQAPEILIPKKNIILDATVLSTLMSCARLTDLRFNHNLVQITGKSTSLEMGSIVHTVLENYYGNVIKGFKKEDAIGHAISAGIEYYNSDEVTNCTAEDRKWALDTCEQYFEHYKNDHWIPLEVEVTKGKILYEDDEIRILWKAKFDLITDTNQGIYPVDHKTMKQRRDTLTLNNQFIGQCILMETRLMFVNKVGFQTSLKPEEKFTRAPINYSFDRLMEWQSMILPYYAKMMLMYEESGYWPPNFTHCESKYGFCQFKSVCESDRGMREEELSHNFKVGKKWDVGNEGESTT